MLSQNASDSVLLDIRDLRVEFVTELGTAVAVDGVSWPVGRGQTVALVGESGCGKSVTALSVMGLLPQPAGRITGGSILFRDEPQGSPVDLAAASGRMMRSIRGRRIAMIFQEPMSCLNPVFTVGEQIAEAIRLHKPVGKRAAWGLAVDMLNRVGIPDPKHRARGYPHELSGGMQQRVMIAMALCCDPVLLIADEPTTALDVTVQAQVLDLLKRLQAETGMSIVLIAHDLSVVAQVADNVCVMYAGKIMERASVGELFEHPLHPYTRALMRCVPRLSQRRERLNTIPGTVANPAGFPPGCRFHPRCEVSMKAARDGKRKTAAAEEDNRSITLLRRCIESAEAEPGGEPALREVRPGHHVACWEAES